MKTFNGLYRGKDATVRRLRSLTQTLSKRGFGYVELKRAYLVKQAHLTGSYRANEG